MKKTAHFSQLLLGLTLLAATGCGSSNTNLSSSEPAAPVCLTTGHCVELKWNPPTSGTVVGYKVYQGTASGGPYNFVADSGLSRDYMVQPLASGTYFFVVTAYNDHGESGYSNEANATTLDALRANFKHVSKEFAVTIK